MLKKAMNLTQLFCLIFIEILFFPMGIHKKTLPNSRKGLLLGNCGMSGLGSFSKTSMIQIVF